MLSFKNIFLRRAEEMNFKVYQSNLIYNTFFGMENRNDKLFENMINYQLESNIIEFKTFF